MMKVGIKFLGKPPNGYNIALKNQTNQKELIKHCEELSENPSLKPDISLIGEGYEYIYSKLEQRHKLFRIIYSSINPTWTLAPSVSMTVPKRKSASRRPNWILISSRKCQPFFLPHIQQPPLRRLLYRCRKRSQALLNIPAISTLTRSIRPKVQKTGTD